MLEQRLTIIKSIRTNMYFARAFSSYNKEQSIKYLSKARNDAKLYKTLLSNWNEDKTKTMIRG